MTVELICVKEGSKLRIRITAYITDEGERYEGVYNNSFNCRFPRDLRSEGRVYRVPDSNVRLMGGGRVARYYGIKATDMVIVQQSHTAQKVWEVSKECVICMNAPSSTVFVPCGHFCCCGECCASLKDCCICRASIQELQSSV